MSGALIKIGSEEQDRLRKILALLTGENIESMFQDEGNWSEIRVGHIPLILFGEISGRFGVGELRRIPVRWGCAYLGQSLDENLVGFPGAIGVRLQSGRSDFALWHRVPEGREDGVSELRPILELEGGIEKLNFRTQERGWLMEEMLQVGFPTRNFPVADYTLSFMKFISLILFRVGQLVAGVDLEPRKFWETDRWPGFDQANRD